MTSPLSPPVPPPVHHGPTWEIAPGWKEGDPFEEKYILPELSLGWHILTWIAMNLLDDEGDPFTPTAEQTRFLLWLYAIDKNGKFLYRDIVFQRLKGHGKDPIAAVIAAVEFVGPSRFSHIQTKRHDPLTGTCKGDPVGTRHPRAWVQIAAVTKKQTENTMSIFSGLFTEECKARHHIDLGKEIIYAYAGQVKIEIVTSNPRALEGARSTFVILGETHHWLETNNGHEMRKVIRRNITKAKKVSRRSGSGGGSGARMLSITNAYDPSEDSVAQRRRESWEEQQAGLRIKTGVLYDSLEASPEAMVMLPRGEEEDDVEFEARVREYVSAVIIGVRGDAYWLDPFEIVQEILDGETSVAEALRFYFNQVTNVEDVWVDPQAVDRSADPLCVEARVQEPGDALRAAWIIRKDEQIVLFLDGSKSRDATGIVACRISDGQLFTMGVWQPPAGARRKKWTVPRGEVVATLHEIFGLFNVVGFFGDPSHAEDEEDSSRYWDGIFDDMHRKYKDRLLLWAAPTGNNQHSVMWDMSSPAHQQLFVQAAERFIDEIEARNDVEDYAPIFMHDGHPALVQHLKNARDYPHPKGYGDSLWKGGRRSARKIDLAVCAVGARMVRRMFLNREPDEPKKYGRLLMDG